MKNHSSHHNDFAADQVIAATSSDAMTRRTFMQAVAASTVTLAVIGCGGGTGADEADPMTDPLPGSGESMTWRTVPTITFTQGVASSVSIANYLDDPGDVVQSITKNPAALPPGVTYDAAGKRFVYDGVGALGSTGGHTLTASDGNP